MLKKFFFTLLVISYFSMLSAQQFQNSGFETWSGSAPSNWKTLGLMGLNVGQNTLSQSTIAHSGSYALKVSVSPMSSLVQMLAGTLGIPDSLLTRPVPGIVTNGTIDVLNLLMGLSTLLEGELDLTTLEAIANYITDGLAVNENQRPVSLSGYGFASIANQGDMASVMAVVYSNDGGTRHIIGGGLANIETGTSHQPFTVEIIYSNQTEKPTEIVFVGLTTSFTSNLSTFSSIIIDDISLAYEPFDAGIGSNTKSTFTISPNPVDNILKISPKMLDVPYNATLFDISGKKVLEINGVTGEKIVDVSSLNSGIYAIVFECGSEKSFTKVIVR